MRSQCNWTLSKQWKVVPYHLVFDENQVIRICRPRRLYQGQCRAKYWIKCHTTNHAACILPYYYTTRVIPIIDWSQRTKMQCKHTVGLEIICLYHLLLIFFLLPYLFSWVLNMVNCRPCGLIWSFDCRNLNGHWGCFGQQPSCIIIVQTCRYCVTQLA